MVRVATIGAFAAAIWMATGATGIALPAGKIAATETVDETFVRVQAQPFPRRRPHIRINPRYPYRNFNAVYPLPYDVEYPGPAGVRQCVNNYVTEVRPSGTVIVPRMRCWWVVRR